MERRQSGCNHQESEKMQEKKDDKNRKVEKEVEFILQELKMLNARGQFKRSEVLRKEFKKDVMGICVKVDKALERLKGRWVACCAIYLSLDCDKTTLNHLKTYAKLSEKGFGHLCENVRNALTKVKKAEQTQCNQTAADISMTTA